MLQVRKLVLAVAAATAFTSSFTYALGLGDLSVKSSLNQPLEAEISLLEVRDLSSIEIKSQLASPEEFSKAGIDRQFLLTGLKFTPVVDANGKSVIRVTSNKPIKEPYLNFLVEVLWPNGRLLREYTLLLDPPLYKPQQVIYAPQPAATVPSRMQPPPQAAAQPQPIARQAAPAPSAAPAARANALNQGGDYRVQKNDTLWEVASRVGGNASVHQTMLAIQDLNPNAFLDGNINRLKSGQVLRLPSEQEINSRSRAEAIAQVTQQNDSWQNARRAPAVAERQLDATHRSEAGAAPAAIEKSDSLRLVAEAPGAAEQAADEGSAANLSALQDQLAASKERLDSTVLENQDLQSRVEDLNSQLEKLQRLIELKDNQLAQLQNAVDTPVADVANDQAAAPAEHLGEASIELADPATEPGIDGVEAISEVTEETAQGVETSAVETEEVAPEAVAQPVEPAAAPEPEIVVESETAAEGAAQAEPATPAQAPVAEQPAAEEKSIIDKIKDDPMLLAGAGAAAVLALLLLLMGISRSRARKEAELFDEPADQELAAQAPEALATPEVDPASAVTASLTATDSAATTEAVDSDDLLEDFSFDAPTPEAAFKDEASDVLAEAESYISFGRFSQAATVLANAVDQEPERLDLRLKLVEVLADLEDHAGVSRQINELTEIGGATAELAQIKARYPHMFGAEQVEAVSAETDFNDFADISLDDLTLDTPSELSSTAVADLDAELDDLSALLAESEPAAKPTDTDFDFDLDLNFSETPETAETKPAELDAGELQFDGADLLAAESTEQPASPELTDDFSLDFALDLPEESSEITKTAAVDDFAELSLDDITLDLTEDSSADAPELELPADFDLAALDEVATPAATTVDFIEQMDEVEDELDALTASLTEESQAATDFSFDELELDLASEPAAPSTPQAEAEPASKLDDFDDFAELGGVDDDFSFLSGTDETATKLDLARAYIDMGDAEGARDILEEVVAEGSSAQQDEAHELMSKIG